MSKFNLRTEGGMREYIAFLENIVTKIEDAIIGSCEYSWCGTSPMGNDPGLCPYCEIKEILKEMQK